jgi:hypothetical protein
VLSLSIFADNKGTFVTTVSKARFCSEELTAYGAYVDKHTDETVTLVIDSKSPRVSMAFKPLMADTEANALRIVIKNDSKCDRMILDYVYKNSAHLSETGVADIAINSDAVSKEYIIPLRSVDGMTKLGLTLDGGDSTGTIAIVSIGAISYCYEDREYYGELTSNT